MPVCKSTVYPFWELGVLCKRLFTDFSCLAEENCCMLRVDGISDPPVPPMASTAFVFPCVQVHWVRLDSPEDEGRRSYCPGRQLGTTSDGSCYAPLIQPPPGSCTCYRRYARPHRAARRCVKTRRRLASYHCSFRFSRSDSVSRLPKRRRSA